MDGRGGLVDLDVGRAGGHEPLQLGGQDGHEGLAVGDAVGVDLAGTVGQAARQREGARAASP